MKALLAIATLLVLALALGCATQKPIGDAKMNADGALHVWLRAEMPAGGGHGDSVMTISPGDKDYQKWLDHLGGMKPGDSKLVPPWPD